MQKKYEALGEQVNLTRTLMARSVIYRYLNRTNLTCYSELSRLLGCEAFVKHVEASRLRKMMTVSSSQGSIGSVDAGHHRRLVGGELLVIGEVLRGIPDDIGHTRGDAQKRHKSHGEEPAQKTQHYTISTCMLPGAG